MKIAVSVAKADLDAPVALSFDDCPLFLVVDSDTWHFQAIENTAAGAENAGEQAAGLVVSAGADAVVAAEFGPGAIGALAGVGLAVYAPQPGMSARQAVEAVIAGELPAIVMPRAALAAGLSCGLLAAKGLWQTARPPAALWSHISDPDAISALREQLNLLREQLEELRRRVERLEKRAGGSGEK